MSIDSFIRKNRFFLAPIAGFTDSPFRRIARKHGAGPVISELISSEAVIRRKEKTLKMIRFHEEERPIGIQLFGRSPQVMGEAAAIVSEYSPDFIDINLGCPSRKVSKGGMGAGGALLLDPERVFRIVESVVKNTERPVSAKIRRGWDNSKKIYPQVIRALHQGGISFITVHGRTVAQKYSGFADWSIIKEIKELAEVPVIGNGDIISYNDAVKKLKESGCDAVMIGRAALGNPWIFAGYKPTVQEIIEQIKEHLEMMIDFYGEKGIVLMRKHLVKYIHGIKNASKVRQKLVVSDSKEDIFGILNMMLK